MSEQKHTPGPWDWDAGDIGQDYSQPYCTVHKDGGNLIIAEVNDKFDRNEGRANARLIADAPRLKRVNEQLVEALRAIAELVEDAKPGDPDDEVLYAIQGWAEPALASAEHQETET